MVLSHKDASQRSLNVLRPHSELVLFQIPLHILILNTLLAFKGQINLHVSPGRE